MKIQKEGFEFDVIDHEFWKDEGSEIDILQDSFFESYKGPLHLSIHTPFYLNKYESLEIVKKTISRYRYYISNLNVINKDINDINHLNEFYSIMLFN